MGEEHGISCPFFRSNTPHPLPVAEVAVADSEQFYDRSPGFGPGSGQARGSCECPLGLGGGSRWLLSRRARLMRSKEADAAW